MNSNTPKLEGKQRGFSMIVDYLIFTILSAVLIMPVALISPKGGATTDHSVFTGEPNMLLLCLFTGLGTALMLCKDSFGGRSFGKRILGQQVVDDATGEVASPMKCFIRNITYPLNVIELIVAYFKPEKRLGDMIAKTHVTSFDPDRPGATNDMADMIKPFALAFLIGALYLFAVTNFSNKKTKNNLQPVAYAESSVNEQAANELKQLFENQYGETLTADAKVYDELNGSPGMPYVSLILKFNDSHNTRYPSFEIFKEEAYMLLLSKYPLGSFVGQVKFIEQYNGKDRLRILPLDWRK